MRIVLAKTQMDENTPTTSKGKKTSSGASSDASSESGVYKMAYSVFDEQYCNSAKKFYTGRSMDAL